VPGNGVDDIVNITALAYVMPQRAVAAGAHRFVTRGRNLLPAAPDPGCRGPRQAAGRGAEGLRIGMTPGQMNPAAAVLGLSGSLLDFRRWFA